MSSGLNCHFYKLPTEPTEWFYVLEDGSAPKEAWDWREFSAAYGPFPTYDVASEHLATHHRNPGGHSVVELPVGEPVEAVLVSLIAQARVENERARSTRPTRSGYRY